MIIDPDVNSVLPLRFDVVWRGMGLIKDQSVFTLFIFEETLQAVNYRVTQLHANKEYTKAGVLSHRTVSDLQSLIYFTGPPTVDANILSTSVDSISTIITGGTTLSFNFFFRASLEHHKYYRGDYPIAGINDSTYASQIYPSPSITSFDQARIRPWNVDVQRFINACGVTGDSMGFCIFIYEEGCQILNALIRKHITANENAEAAALAVKYLPEIVPLVEWSSADPANVPSIILSRGMSLFYLNFFKATLRTFLYARSLDPATSTYNGVKLTDMQYIGQDGTLKTMSSNCSLEGEVLVNPTAIIAALKAAGLG